MQQGLGQQGSRHSSGIFVLSLPRTGSTVLRLILDTHPEIFCPDEIHLGRLLKALYDTNEGLAEAGGTAAINALQIDPASPWAATTGHTVAEMLGAAASRKGKSLWCDKSPSNLEHLATIAALLPESRYILLHRHCLDFAISCLRFSTYGFFLTVVEDYVRKDHKNFLRALVRAWNDYTRELLRFEAEHAGSCHRLRYEDLVISSEETSRRMFEYLGVPFDPQLLQRVFSSPHHQRAFNGDPNALFSRAIVDQGVGRGAELNPAAFASIPAELLQGMNELLVTLGYPAVEITAKGFDMHLAKTAAPRPAAGSAVPPAIPAAAIFAMIGQRLGAQPAIAGKVKASFKFVLGGEGGGCWVLDLTEPPGRVIPDGVEAQCVITTSAADFAEIVAGRLNPAVAVRQDRMRIEGQVDDAALRELIGALVAA
ncbi:MAG TPA: sulfotransferase [Thermoanaerobaculia bacterium]|nr:sulfotransferase [Thermoanaerobaculia bacterium]